MIRKIKTNDEENYRNLISTLDKDDNYELIHQSREVIPSNRFNYRSIHELAFYHCPNLNASLSLKAFTKEDNFEAEYTFATEQEDDLDVLESTIKSFEKKK